MTQLAWLHISDWHQKEPVFDRQVVGDAILKEVTDRVRLNPALETIDFVVFSGDISFSGKTEQFNEAEARLIKPLLNILKLPTDRLILVPGNHDLDRDLFSYLPSKLVNPLNSPVELEEWLGTPRGQKSLLDPFEHYLELARNYQAEGDQLMKLTRIKKDDNTVGIACFNSALLCGRNKNQNGAISDQGYLMIGESLVDRASRDGRMSNGE